MLTLHDLNKLKEDENNSDTNLLSHYGMDSFNDKKLKVFLWKFRFFLFRKKIYFNIKEKIKLVQKFLMG